MHNEIILVLTAFHFVYSFSYSICVRKIFPCRLSSNYHSGSDYRQLCISWPNAPIPLLLSFCWIVSYRNAVHISQQFKIYILFVVPSLSGILLGNQVEISPILPFNFLSNVMVQILAISFLARIPPIQSCNFSEVFSYLQK